MVEVIEIVSDSEEERKRVSASKIPVVIEISSDSEDGAPSTAVAKIPAKRKPLRHRATRKVIESSPEPEDESVQHSEPPTNTIELTLDEPYDKPTTPVRGKVMTPTRPTIAQRYQSLYSDNEDSDSDSDVFEDALDSIITYDPPKSANKPVRTTPLETKIPPTETARRKRMTTPKQPAAPDTRPAASSTPRGSKGTSKQAQEAAKRKELEEYAQQFFDDINQNVLGNGLPADTKLVWNVRLLTTAGRARWHKNRHGEETSEIELAPKILTTKERIRNTLSHEMCHLASWVIDKQVNEAHGPTFKKWGSRVMKAYPDVEVTTRHTYEISYKYEWKCTNCPKIYGRHSKSINPDECLCGACKTGKLVPLFPTRTPQKTGGSSSGKMATTQPRDSPIRMPDLFISVPSDEDPSDSLDDLTATVEGIKI